MLNRRRLAPRNDLTQWTVQSGTVWRLHWPFHQLPLSQPSAVPPVQRHVELVAPIAQLERSCCSGGGCCSRRIPSAILHPSIDQQWLSISTAPGPWTVTGGGPRVTTTSTTWHQCNVGESGGSIWCQSTIFVCGPGTDFTVHSSSPSPLSRSQGGKRQSKCLRWNRFITQLSADYAWQSPKMNWFLFL